MIENQIEDAVKKFLMKYYKKNLTMIRHDFEGERTIKYAHSVSLEERYWVQTESFYLENGKKIEVLFARCCDKIYYDWRIIPPIRRTHAKR